MFFATKTEEGSRVRTQTFTTLHVVYNVFTLHLRVYLQCIYSYTVFMGIQCIENEKLGWF
jgi:hypothetical protein